MNDSHKIPAASIDDIDLGRIRAQDPQAAAEVQRLGELLDYGNETEEDIVSLGDLLAQYGEIQKSEELLRRNIGDIGDPVYIAYRRLHGFRIDRVLLDCMDAFERQFGVRLHSVENLGLDRRKAISQAFSTPTDVGQDIQEFIATACVIEFRCGPGECWADIGSLDPAFPEQDYIVLQYKEGSWRLDQLHRSDQLGH